MSTIQARIPFKSRKNTNVKSKNIRKTRSNVENINLLNTNEIVPRLKRCPAPDPEHKTHSDDELECSPQKISRQNENETEEPSLRPSVDRTENKLKPLISREKEIEWLEEFLSESLDKEQSASLYISGQPGTGKTACLTYILEMDKFKNGYTQVYVNCTAVKTAASIYSRICKELRLRPAAATEKACLNAIEKYLSGHHKMTLLVLDEIDQLLGARGAVLYGVWSWPARCGRLVLLGVANSLDLTARALPRLQARAALRPRTLHFAPYTKQQILAVLEAQLREQAGAAFQPAALQMLAAKISAISGDMRRALDTGRRVAELARRGLPAGAGAPAAAAPAAPAAPAAVELRHVLQVVDEVYGGGGGAGEGLPLQQKLILGCLVLIRTKAKNKDLTMGRLHDVYKRVAAARNIAPLDIGELAGACALLEARGALRVAAGGAGGAGGARGRRLRLQWDEAALGAALRDTSLLASILDDVGCLAP